LAGSAAATKQTEAGDAVGGSASSGSQGDGGAALRPCLRADPVVAEKAWFGVASKLWKLLGSSGGSLKLARQSLPAHASR